MHITSRGPAWPLGGAEASGTARGRQIRKTEGTARGSARGGSFVRAVSLAPDRSAGLGCFWTEVKEKPWCDDHLVMGNNNTFLQRKGDAGVTAAGDRACHTWHRAPRSPSTGAPMTEVVTGKEAAGVCVGAVGRLPAPGAGVGKGELRLLPTPLLKGGAQPAGTGLGHLHGPVVLAHPLNFFCLFYFKTIFFFLRAGLGSQLCVWKGRGRDFPSPASLTRVGHLSQ